MKNSILSPLTIGRFGTHYLITYPTPIAGDQSATAILAECGSLERAELIVQAVNSHQALVDACRSALADMSDMQGVRLEEACPVTFEKLRAALALATK